MDIVINLDKLADIFSQPADVLVANFFLYVGWIPVAWLLLWMAWVLWIYYIQEDYGSKREFILLALDVPVENEQTPVAVEKLFAHLAGAHGSINLWEQYWDGKTQDAFSFEIVSIDGYTQYLIRTMPKYRGLVEAAVYAEYPGAEITEVTDYVTGMPDRFPDDVYDLWGSEYILRNSSYYPIRTYKEFEHQLSGDFKDPLAAMIELFSGLYKGEQCWYQIILTPVGQHFHEGADKEINKVVGFKPKSAGGKDIADRIINPLLKFLSGLADFIVPGGEDETQKEDEPKLDMLNLKPLQKKAAEAIQQKVSKLVFDVKIRFIYIAEKEALRPSRNNSFTGVMKQFGVEDLNQLKPDTEMTMTKTHYFFKEKQLNRRKTNIIVAYKARSNWLGRLSFTLNIEELATIWHFPVESAVKAPLLQKVPSRKSEAPGYLPVGGTTSAAESELNFIEELGIDGAEKKPEKYREEIKRTPEKEIFTNGGEASSGDKIRAEPAAQPENLPIG